MEDHHINFLHKQLPHQEESKTPKKKKWFFLILASLILILMITTSYVSANRSGNIEYDPVTLEPKKPEGLFKKLSYLVFGRDTTLQGEQYNRVNVLLIGMGGLGHDGPYLTDTIMIASIEPSTNDIGLISIPRDLGAKIKDKGWYKINYANHFGELERPDWGGAYATQVISETFGLDIPYYIRVDFQAFEEIIDEVGGVRVDVDRAFNDYMYPAQNDLYQTLTFQAGPQTMDGDTALKFVRSRHGNNGEGSDFARATRQQKVMLALKEKVLSFSTLTNPIRIKNVMDTLERHMTTNMDFDEIMTFVRMTKQLNTDKIHTLVLDNGPTGYLANSTTADGSYILSPKTGNFDEISQVMKEIFEVETSQQLDESVVTHEDTTPVQDPPTYDDIVVEIQNGTWRAGLAARVKQLLLDESYFVEGLGNTPIEFKPITDSAVYIISDDAEESVAEKISATLNVTYQPQLPTGIEAATGTDILVVLGEDFTE